MGWNHQPETLQFRRWRRPLVLKMLLLFWRRNTNPLLSVWNEKTSPTKREVRKIIVSQMWWLGKGYVRVQWLEKWKEEVFPENNEFSIAILLYRTLYFGRRWFADQTIDPIPNLTNQIRISGGDVHSLKLAAKAPEHRPQRLRRKWSYSNYIHFQVRSVSFNNGILILTRSFVFKRNLNWKLLFQRSFTGFCCWKPGLVEV